MLAAGNSRRFGSNKLLHEIEGKPMYLHVLEQLLKVQKQTENCKLAVVTQYPEIKKTAGKIWGRSLSESYAGEGHCFFAGDGA